MGSWTGFLLTYLLGGVTFVPLVLLVVLTHAHLAFPARDNDHDKSTTSADAIVQPGDDTTDLKSFQSTEQEGVKSKQTDTSDVAAGYFAVCREYTPMGINAKPIERSTPVGSATVAAPSQSVYQAMYRSIFDRKQSPGGPLDHSAASQRPKRAGNVFYVVLRHGHLMLFDDDEQLEVRHVISLAHHDISIYSGGGKTPEGELYIKRNALCLSRTGDGKESGPESQPSKPFYLFSENCSAKEDFYFALIKNQEQVFGAQKKAPQPQQFDVKNILALVQRLHSSEEHMQMRWLNAFLGRLFLALYKTRDVENAIREKLTKKLSRVNRPNFLTRIAIEKIDTGDSAPYFTNPRLRDLSVEGEFAMETDVKYTGNCRLQVAATAKIDLGTRFKTREVNLVLAVVLKKLEGHVVFKIKPPPSNRIWFSFLTMPKMEMTIEPIVSARQITYTVILRQIENRIKEIVAETLVHPFWDDIPFFSTEHKQWRGGIFEGDDAVEHSEDFEEMAASLGDVDELTHMEEASMSAPSMAQETQPLEKGQTFPGLGDMQSTGFWGRKSVKKFPTVLASMAGQEASVSTTSLDDTRPPPLLPPETPRPLRTGSYSESNPTVGTDSTHAELYRPTSSPADNKAATMMANVAAKVQSQSHAHTPLQKPFDPAGRGMPAAHTSDKVSASPAEVATPDSRNGRVPVSGRRETALSMERGSGESRHSSSPAPSSRGSVKAHTTPLSAGGASTHNTETEHRKNGVPEPRRNALAAVANVATTAKRWGWNAIQRNADQGSSDARRPSEPQAAYLKQPMGRGQPLPPPGTPLPGPDRRAKVTSIPVPRRKPMPPPTPDSPARHSTSSLEGPKLERRPVPPPPLPQRSPASSHEKDDGTEKVLGVEAPAESAPTSPASARVADRASASCSKPWAEDNEELDGRRRKGSLQKAPSSRESTKAPSSRESTKAPSSRESTKAPPSRDSSPPQLPRRAHISRATPVVGEEEELSNWLENPEFGTEDEQQPIVATPPDSQKRHA